MSRIVLVTGAAVGIGAEIARKLGTGQRIALHYHRSRREAEELGRELALHAEQVECIGADLSTDAGCVHLHREMERRFGALDVLVNNAGGMIERQAVRDLTWGHLEATFALNVLSTMRLSGLCVPLLERGTHSCIINVTSIAIRHGAPTATAYGAAKAAIDAFTRGAAAELAPRIRVNAVAPGIIDTRFHERVTSPEKMQRFQAQTPLQRFGAAAEVAAAVEFLVASEFMTGETMDLNGGLFMR